jgi:hypothetical protein
LGSFRTFDTTRLGSFCTLGPGGAGRGDLAAPRPLPIRRPQIGFVSHDCPSALRGLGDLARHLPGGKLGSFRIFCPPKPCPGRAKLGSFRTIHLAPDTSNLKLLPRLGSFRAIAPRRSLPAPVARAHSWALGRDWLCFARSTPDWNGGISQPPGIGFVCTTSRAGGRPEV